MVLMPVTCWNICRHMQINTTLRIPGRSSTAQLCLSRLAAFPLELVPALDSEKASNSRITGSEGASSATGSNPRSLLSARSASSRRPLRSSHLGDSGRRSRASICRMAGTTDTPSMSLHFPSVTMMMARSIRYEAKMPQVMKSWGTVASWPRLSRSTHSAMYTGTTAPAVPMAKPTTKRPSTNVANVGDHARRAPPSKNTCAPSCMARFCPARSARGPAASVPSTAPTVVADTTRPLTPGRCSSPNSGTRNSRAPAMTPVS
eukprot:scaffold7340_cov266-Pinguiococcus_pyrenoidosus.AAC.29